MGDPQHGESSSLNDDLNGLINEYSIPHMVDLNTESLLTQSQYAKVIFHEIADTYSTDADICCRYSLTSGVIPKHGDRIALYLVGWSSVQEYILFEWAPEVQPEGQEELQVLFKAASLPKDVTEFYQLCYLTSENNVCGASVPFQFRRPQDDDLCVVDGPDDMVLVRSRSALAEEKLRQAVKATITLQKEKEEVDKKLQELSVSYGTVKKELQDALQQVSQLETANQALQKELSDMAHLDRLVTSLKHDYQVLDDEKNESGIKLQQLEHHVEVLSATITALTTDKEHLAKLLRAEMSQQAGVEQYRAQANGLQAMLDALTQSKELVTQELYSEQQISNKLRKELNQAKKQIEDLQNQIKELNMEKQDLKDLLAQSLSSQPVKSDDEGDDSKKMLQLQKDKEKLLVDHELATMRHVIQKRTEECEALQEQLTSARMTVCEQDVILGLRHQKVGALELALLEKEDELLQMKQKLKVTEDLLSLKADNTDNGSEQNILTKRISELEQEKEQLENLLKESKSYACSANASNLEELKAEKAAVEIQLKEANSLVTMLGERIVTINTRLEELKKEIEINKIDLEQVSETCKQQCNELSVLHESKKDQEKMLNYSIGAGISSDEDYFSQQLLSTTLQIEDVTLFVESSKMHIKEVIERLTDLDQEKMVLKQQLEHAEITQNKHKENAAELEKKSSEILHKIELFGQPQSCSSEQIGTSTSEQDQNTDMLQDLKKRLQLAATEYQKLYQEKQKTERRLTKLLNRKTAASPVSATVQDVMTVPQDSDTDGQVPTNVATGGLDFCFICPFCKVTFSLDGFTQHFNTHLS